MSNTYQGGGLSRVSVNQADLLWGTTDVQFATWDMLGPIGPISGPGRLLQWSMTPLIDTTGGVLIFDDGDYNVTFTATPEPTTLLLFGLGGLMLRRKR